MKNHRTAAILSVLALEMLASQLRGQSTDPLDQWQWCDPTPPPTYLNDVVFANGQFIGLGFLAVLVTSDDGTDWKALGLAPMESPTGLAYGDGTYVLVGWVDGDTYDYGTACPIATSPDGVVWTPQYGPPGYSGFGGPGPAGTWWTVSTAGPGRAIVYGNGLFVVPVTANGAPGFLTSPDGVQWTLQTFGDITAIWSLAFGNGLFVALGCTGSYLFPESESFLLTSQDGQVWTKHLGGTDGWLGWVDYGNGTFVRGWRQFVYGGAGWQPQSVAVSTDLVTWTTNAGGGSTTFVPGSIAYGNGLFVASEDSGALWASPDGLHWAMQSPGLSNVLSSVAYGNSVFVGTRDGAVPWVSSDAAQWTQVRPEWANFEDVVYACGRFVAVGDPGFSLSSTDGAQWSASPSGAQYLRSITYADGQFVAVGGTNAATSADGLHWSLHPTGTTNNLLSIAYGNGVFVAVGGTSDVGVNTGSILTSTNGADWVLRDPGTNVEFRVASARVRDGKADAG
jgi:hypothetical protein